MWKLILTLAFAASACGPTTASDLAGKKKTAGSGGGGSGAPFVPRDPGKTPGSLCTESDPNFKELRYAQQIPYCQRNVSQGEKQQIADAYGVPKAEWSQYEFDHLIPLSIGGTDDISNIWPQRLDQAHVKDKLEYTLYVEINAGKITQDEAVSEILAWHM